jgi:hypothetical protein
MALDGSKGTGVLGRILECGLSTKETITRSILEEVQSHRRQHTTKTTQTISY